MKFRIVTLVFLFCGLSFAQDEKKKEKPEKKEKTIEELTK